MPKHQHTAVERNRLKRRLRELVRVDLLPALGTERPLDVAIRAQSDAYRATFPALRQEMHALLGKIRNSDPDRS